jgi:hypothetical protein
MMGNRFDCVGVAAPQGMGKDMDASIWTAVKAANMGLALAVAFGCAATHAQTQDRPARQNRRPPLRIEIVPRQFYRQCVDWYDIEHRPTGDTIVPRMRCRWAIR